MFEAKFLDIVWEEYGTPYQARLEATVTSLTIVPEPAALSIAMLATLLIRPAPRRHGIRPAG